MMKAVIDLQDEFYSAQCFKYFKMIDSYFFGSIRCRYFSMTLLLKPAYYLESRGAGIDNVL